MTGSGHALTGIQPADIIVVNDNPTQLAILSALLKKEGLTVQSFPGAEEALAAMRGGTPPDLIVTDLYMPGIDGWRFCRLLRSPEYEDFNTVPILVISATFKGDEPDRITADLGANAFLPAPVDGRQLIDQVRMLLDGAKPAGKLRVLIVEDITVLANMLKEVFESNGYAADTAETVKEARECLRRTAYELAVLDYHLPDGKGDVVLATARQVQPDCACIMMTTDPGPELALAFMSQGAAAYVRKPFQPEYLIELCIRVRRERALLRSEDLLEIRTRELRESEARYRELVENMNDVIYKVGPDGIIKYVSPSVERVLGYSAADVVGRAFDFAIYPNDRKRIKIALGDILKGVTYPGEYRMLARDGSVRWVHTYTSLIRDGEHISVMQGVLTDITARKQAEQELKLSQLHLRLFIDANTDMMFLKDSELRYQMINAANAAFFGLDEAEILGKTDGELMSEQAALAFRESDLQAMLQKRVVTTIEEVGDKAYETRKVPVIIEGKAVGVAGIIRDITGRRTLEEQLRQAHKLESVGRLAGGVAHGFNNMLSVILGNTEQLMEGTAPSDPCFASLEEIRKAVDRSADLTRQLLAFARKQVIDPRVLDLNETVEDTLRIMQRIIGENIRLTWLPAMDLWPVRMDPSQVGQILANLFVNARDAIGGAGRITIETGNSLLDYDECAAHEGVVPGEYVRLAVSDDGCGMNEETLAHIFDPFFTTKDIGKGTGLGLASVYGAVKQNNGFIDASSEEGKGTTIAIYLPRHKGNAILDQASAETPQAGPGNTLNPETAH